MEEDQEEVIVPPHFMVPSKSSPSSNDQKQANETSSDQKGVWFKVKIKLGKNASPSRLNAKALLAHKIKQEKDFQPRHLQINENTGGTVIAEDDVCLVMDTQPRPKKEPDSWHFVLEDPPIPTKKAKKTKVIKHVPINLKTELSCTYCQMTFKCEKMLQLHMNIHNKLRCPLCTFCCNEQKNMIRHIKTFHTDDKNMYKCKLCLFKSRSQTKLEHHSKTNHIITNNFYCVTCSKSFTTKQELTVHEREHVQKIFPCEFCKNTYSSRHSLMSHRCTASRGHTANFICPTCKKMFSTNGQYVQHIFQHTNELPFGCNQCEFLCAQYSDLKIHLISVHGDHENNKQ